MALRVSLCALTILAIMASSSAASLSETEAQARVQGCWDLANLSDRTVVVCFMPDGSFGTVYSLDVDEAVFARGTYAFRSNKIALEYGPPEYNGWPWDGSGGKFSCSIRFHKYQPNFEFYGCSSGVGGSFFYFNKKQSDAGTPVRAP